MATSQFQPAALLPLPPQVQVFVPQAPVSYNKVVSSKGWYIAKIALGAASILTSITIFGLGGGLVAAQDGQQIFNAYIDILMAFPPAFLAIVWQSAEFITLCVRRNRGIHPGAQVGMQLVIWLAFLAIGGSITWFLSDDASTSYWLGDCCSDADEAGYATYLALEEALVAFLWLSMIIHLILFIRACIECNRRNKNRRESRRAPGGYYDPIQQMAQPPAIQQGQYLQPQYLQPQELQHQPLPPQNKDENQQMSHDNTYGQFNPQAQQGMAELKSGPETPSPAAIEISGAPRYAEMQGEPRYVEMQGEPRYVEIGSEATYVQQSTPNT